MSPGTMQYVPIISQLSVSEQPEEESGGTGLRDALLLSPKSLFLCVLTKVKYWGISRLGQPWVNVLKHASDTPRRS